MIDVVLRCFSRARWITVATNRGIYDAQGNVNPGFAVDEIGSVELTPGVYDRTTVITPPVMDTWYWINLRIYGQKAIDDVDATYPGEEGDTSGFKFNKSKFVKWFRDQATLVNLTYRGRTVRAYQVFTTSNRIQVIDPRDYHDIRCREWLGGQQF